jgi:TPR repeat protein
MQSLGMFYYVGEIVEQNYEEAFKWFNKAADQGFSMAIYSVAFYYYHGIGTTIQNSSTAEKYLLLAVEKDNIDAMILLTKYYFDISKGKEVIDLCNNLHGIETLANCYHFGNFVGQDTQKAIQLCTKAMEISDDVKYIKILANYYYENDQNNKIYDLYHKYVTETDITSAIVMNELAHCYQYGIGTELDLMQAVKWYKKAADLGNEKAINNLNNMVKTELSTLIELFVAMKMENEDLRLINDHLKASPCSDYNTAMEDFKLLALTHA